MAPYGVVLEQMPEQSGQLDPDTGAMLPPVVRVRVDRPAGSEEQVEGITI